MPQIVLRFSLGYNIFIDLLDLCQILLSFVAFRYVFFLTNSHLTINFNMSLDTSVIHFVNVVASTKTGTAT